MLIYQHEITHREKCSGNITENKDMIELNEIKEGESVDMCDAWKKFYEKARQEGFTYKVYRRIQRSVI